MSPAIELVRSPTTTAGWHHADLPDVNHDHALICQLLAPCDEATVWQGTMLLEKHDVEEQTEANGQQRCVENVAHLVLGEAGD